MSANDLMLGEFVSALGLEILNRGSDFDTTPLTITDVNRPGLQFHDFYDYFDPRRIQVIGKAETMYLHGFTPDERRRSFDALFQYSIPAMVITRGLSCFPECMESAVVHGRTLLQSPDTTVDFSSRAIEFLTRRLAPFTLEHGVLLEVFGEGVMITGDSGVGKSEVSMELIMRGHRLVADDAVELRRISNQLIGTAPAVIRHYIELRGIGVINVRKLLGMRAIRMETGLDLVIHFEPWDQKKLYDRLGIETNYTEILGVQVPLMTIPVRPGRNLASIVEVAAMNNRNRKFGSNDAEELAANVDRLADGH